MEWRALWLEKLFDSCAAAEPVGLIVAELAAKTGYDSPEHCSVQRWIVSASSSAFGVA